MLNKLKWVIGIALIFILILATNLIDQRNFRQVKESIVTIYEDHLVSKDMVIELSSIVHEKAIAVALCDSSFFAERNKMLNQRMDELIVDLRNVNLTKQAQTTLDLFQSDFEDLKALEAGLPQNNDELAAKLNDHGVANELSDLGEDLNKLAKIQFEEGRNEMFVGKKAVAAVELLTKIEIYILLGLALLVQVIILYTPKSKRT